MKILICGLPGSGKSTLAEPFAELINGIWLNADQVRTLYDDWDFSLEGRLRQAQRMRHLADGVVMAGRIAVADFVCPTSAARAEFAADYTVFMNTLEASKSTKPAAPGTTFAHTDSIFEPVQNANYNVATWFNDTHTELTKVVNNYILAQQGKPTERL
jgi:adenylylsulfate kinase